MECSEASIFAYIKRRKLGILYRDIENHSAEIVTTLQSAARDPGCARPLAELRSPPQPAMLLQQSRATGEDEEWEELRF